ncbi:MAG: extracellular solute-binding protein, partial [Thermotogae bacterium]|nr:extracellular solute-binding protein [Thermotogota bacterium]
GGGNIYMFKNVPKKVKEAAWKFLKYVTEPVNSLYWSLTTGYMTCRVSAFDSVLMGKHFEEEPRGLLTYKQLEYARRRPYFGPYPEVNSIIRSEWEAVMTKVKSPENGVKDAAVKAQKALDEYYK